MSKENVDDKLASAPIAIKERSSLLSAFFSMPKAHQFLLFFLFFLPLQARILKPFHKLAKLLTPSSLDLPSCFAKKILFYTSDLCFLAFLIAALSSLKIDWRRFFWNGPAKYLSALAIISLLSLLFSQTPYFPLQYVKLFQYLLPFLLFCLIPYCFDARSFNPFLKNFFWAVFSISLLQSLIALVQYFTQDTLGLKFLGEPSHIKRFSFLAPGGIRWIFDQLFHHSRGVDYICRISGTMPHPNILGGFLFLGLMTSYTLYFEKYASKAKWLLLGGIFLQIVALFLTFSRSAMIATTLGTLLWFYLISFRCRNALQANDTPPHKTPFWINSLLAVKKILLPLIFTFLLGIGTCLTLFYTPLTHRGGVVNYNNNAQISDDERLTYQEVAVQMIEQHPLLGVGFNHFQIEMPKYGTKELTANLLSKVHNIYLLVYAEQGLLGLTAFLLFIFSVLRRSFRSAFNPFHASLFAAFIGYLFIGCCDFYLLRTNFMMFLFFGISAFLAAPSLLANRPLA